METDFRGSFQIYSEMKPGTVFAFRNKDGARQLAMKAQYERHGRPASNHIIRFYEGAGQKQRLSALFVAMTLPAPILCWRSAV